MYYNEGKFFIINGNFSYCFDIHDPFLFRARTRKGLKETLKSIFRLKFFRAFFRSNTINNKHHTELFFSVVERTTTTITSNERMYVCAWKENSFVWGNEQWRKPFNIVSFTTENEQVKIVLFWKVNKRKPNYGTWWEYNFRKI